MCFTQQAFFGLQLHTHYQGALTIKSTTVKSSSSMASQRKQHRKPTNKVGNKNSGKSTDASEPLDSDSQGQKERLDRELDWCIEQLRLGIAGKSSSATQIAEAARVLRMLENPSTPAPKKRLLMKSTFGDYRKKMSDELRQIDEKAKNDRTKVYVGPVPQADQRKSTFYRRSNASSSLSSSAVAASDGSEAARFHCDTAVMRDTSDGGSFMFNFPTNDIDDANDTDKATAGMTDSSTSSRTNKPTSSVTGNTADGVDDMTTKGGDFRLTNTALRFSSSAEDTPFLFNFDSS